jgi:hypothetical protein
MVKVLCCGYVFSLEVKGASSLLTNKYVLFMEFGIKSNSIKLYNK